MAVFPKDDMLPDFRRGLELFNDKDLPAALRSSCLALVAQQEIQTNIPPHCFDIESPKK